MQGGIATDLAGPYPGAGPASCTIDGDLYSDSVLSTYYHSLGSSANDWVSISIPSSATVNTILYIAVEHFNCCPERNVDLEFRVGADAGPLTNSICVPSPI